MAAVKTPIATYRLQFTGNFRFDDARGLLQYLRKLGVSHIYASPILRARRGSTHGYDVTDPARINSELGTDEDFNALTAALTKNGMGLLMDIVPNHMAASPENPLWQDARIRGDESPYRAFFDMDWLSFDGEVESSAGYRRFFDIGELAGVRVEDARVFEATHSLILRLVREGKVAGLRIDHIDGLFNPGEYLQRLQEKTNLPGQTAGFYLVVEKIISGDESLATDWPVSGTTGYEFAALLNRFFVDGEGLRSLEGTYREFTGGQDTFNAILYQNKKRVMADLFSRELAALGSRLSQLVRRSGLSFTSEKGVAALTEVTARLPVYRTYITGYEIQSPDRRVLERVFSELDSAGISERPAVTFLRRVLAMDFLPGLSDDEKTSWLRFIMRWQQLTGAIMAKGGEDTALYNYGRLLSLNEVGGAPDAGGLRMEEFHRFNLERYNHWSGSLNTTSTHDTKRSEDVRARISVLSEFAEEWSERLFRWRKMNQAKKSLAGGQLAPEAETENFIYQTLLGAWPLSVSELPEFKERVSSYMVKAMREAKGRTNWLKPDQEYEQAVLSFIKALTAGDEKNAFLNDFTAFQNNIARLGMLNSLAQTLLKITLPGVPDIYRGTELWDFSLVDPDNRRPVNFKRRDILLDEIIHLESGKRQDLLAQLLTSWQDGRVKLYLTWKALNTRRTHPELFRRGEYLPVEVTGGMSEEICAFIRGSGSQRILVVVPRFFSRLTAPGTILSDKGRLRDTSLLLPGDMTGNWQDIFTGRQLQVSAGRKAELAEVLAGFPVAMLLYNQVSPF